MILLVFFSIFFWNCFEKKKSNTTTLAELQQSNRELLTRCDDLQEELKVKNTQFSALHMKFVEVEKLLELEKSTTTRLQTENER